MILVVLIYNTYHNNRVWIFFYLNGLLCVTINDLTSIPKMEDRSLLKKEKEKEGESYKADVELS